jgi:hypothetical protein
MFATGLAELCDGIGGLKGQADEDMMCYLARMLPCCVTLEPFNVTEHAVNSISGVLTENVQRSLQRRH